MEIKTGNIGNIDMEELSDRRMLSAMEILTPSRIDETISERMICSEAEILSDEI
jgi:hypothetical protein